MAEIITDGTRSVTSDDASARDYSGRGGYGYGGHPNHYDNVVATSLNGRAAELAVEKTGAATMLGIQVAAGALGVQNEKTSAASLLAVEKTAAATLLAISVSNAATNLAIEKVAAAAELSAERNRNAITMQLAECCCELKELVRAEGGATREKMDTNRIRELELALARVPSLPLAHP